MAKGIHIPVEKSGFPITIGELEFWFDDSYENMRDFIDKHQAVQDKLAEIEKKRDEIEASDDDEVTKADKSFELKREELQLQYDAMLGDGAFEKIYEHHPKIFDLEKILASLDSSVGDAITKRLKEQRKERRKLIDTAKQEVLNKKKAKTK